MPPVKSQITHRAIQLVGYVTLACKERFRGSYLGFLWAMLHPLIPLLVHNVVFAHLLGRDPVEFVLYLAAGFFPWFFLSQAIQMNNRGLLRHMKLLRARPTAVPLLFTGEVMTSMLPLLAWLPALWLLEPSNPLGLVVSTLSFIWGVTALSFLLSLTQIFFRDLQFLLPLGLQCGLFLSPILYPRENWPLEGVLSHPAWINPLYLWIEPIQSVLHGEGPTGLGFSLLLSLGVTLVASSLWQGRRSEAILHA